MVSRRTIIIIAVAVAVAVLAVAVAVGFLFRQEQISSGKQSPAIKDLAAACRLNRGTWLIAHDECQGADAGWCLSNGGLFQKCASACRNSPDQNLACAAPCVSACSFRRSAPIDVSRTGSVLNGTYIFNGRPVDFEGGRAMSEIDPGKAYRSEGRIIAQTPPGDVDGDGVDDIGVIITAERGGSAGPEYLALAQGRAGGGFQGTNALPLGDRVSLLSSTIRDGEVRVSYADRYPWEAWSAGSLTVNKVKRAILQQGQLQDKPPEGGPLTEDTAMGLAVEQWGDCSGDRCSSLAVKVIDDRDGVWYVQATYDGQHDDSIRARRLTMMVRYFNSAWQRGQVVLEENQCQPGRGHQEFSPDPCL